MASLEPAVRVAAEFRRELTLLDRAASGVMLDAWQAVEASLLDDMERFAARFEPGDELTRGQLLRMERFQALHAQVEAQLAALENVAAGAIDAGTRQAVALGVEQGVASLESLGVSAGFNRLPAAAVENITSLARAGKPLADLLAPMYGQAAEGILRELTNGVALGLGPRQIARRMAQDGLTDSLNHLLLVTRDQYNRAHRTAALETYRESNVVAGYVRRCARQAGRTCIACIALDGTFYKLDQDFEEHPQGRCTLIPIIAGAPPTTLSSGRTWFKSLSEEEQRATMGPGMYDAWKKKEIGFDDMVQRDSHPVWGGSVRPRSLRSARKQPPRLGARLPKAAKVPKAAEPAALSVANIKTTKQAEAYLAGKHPGVRFDFEGIHDDHARPIASELDRLLDKYPDVERRLEYVGTYADVRHPVVRDVIGYGETWGGGEMAHATTRTGTRMGLNPAYFGNPARLRRALEEAERGNWLDADHSVESLISHEFGHLLDGSMWDKASARLIGHVYSMDNRFRMTNLRTEFIQRFSPTKSSLSEYALTDEKEAFAEAFSQMERLADSQWSPFTKRLNKLISGYDEVLSSTMDHAHVDTKTWEKATITERKEAEARLLWARRLLGLEDG